MTGSTFRHYRLSLNLSQTALGERWGVQRSTIARWEASDRVPDWIADALVGVRLERSGLALVR